MAALFVKREEGAKGVPEQQDGQRVVLNNDQSWGSTEYYWKDQTGLKGGAGVPGTCNPPQRGVLLDTVGGGGRSTQVQGLCAGGSLLRTACRGRLGEYSAGNWRPS